MIRKPDYDDDDERMRIVEETEVTWNSWRKRGEEIKDVEEILIDEEDSEKQEEKPDKKE